MKAFIIYLKWVLRGKHIKSIKGGWCGCCGKWVEKVEFVFKDYQKIDNFYDRNTICDSCGNKT